MRGDFEILGYNMIQWLCGSLPWEKDLSDQIAVQKQKEKAFENIPQFLNKCFQNSVPEPMIKYMTLLANIKFNETPDYEKFKKILVDGLKQLSHKPDGKLEFKNASIISKATTPKTTPQKLKKVLPPSRKSPRTKQIKGPSPMTNNLDDSNVGIIIDKKRGRANDLRRVLHDIDSDEEYDIKIVKKTKKQANVKETNKTKIEKALLKNNKKLNANSHHSSATDSEPEIIPSGTKSRNVKRSTKTTPKTTRKLVIRESDSDEDMFET